MDDDAIREYNNAMARQRYRNNPKVREAAIARAKKWYRLHPEKAKAARKAYIERMKRKAYGLEEVEED